MGREVKATLTWAPRGGGAAALSADCTLLLEADALIWRGGLRGRLLRSELHTCAAVGEDLVVQHGSGVLHARLGAKAAGAWAAALAKAPPSLAEKMGLARAGVQVLGTLTDADLAAAAAPYQRATCPLLLAEIHTAAQMQAALAALARTDGGALWAVVAKGKAAQLSDATLRQAARAAGFIDSKSCGVSATMTATRYSAAKGRA